MGYWAKDGSYIRDEYDNMNDKEDIIKVTGGASYDERIDFSERQKSMNHYGEPIKVTGGASYDERLDFSESQVKLAQKRDKLKFEAINILLKEFPKKKEDLIFLLDETEYRLDLMKQLVEYYKEQFLEVANQYRKDYSLEASSIVNSKLTEYLCLVETLKSCGYNFGSNFDSYTNTSSYDSYKPDTQLLDIMSIMHVRRKNGADVEIIFPINYDLNNIEYQIKGDSITIINIVNEHLKNNLNVNILWSKSGYKFSDETKLERFSL